MKRVLVSAAALALLSSGALAADIPMEPAAVIAPVPDVQDWAGLFLGIQGGYAWGSASYDADVESTDGFDGEFDVDGFAVGVYGGSNFQRGNWVFGLDSSISYSEIEGGEGIDVPVGTPDIDVDSELNWFSTTRGKVGYSFGNWLLFVAGGAAMGENEVTLSGADDEVSDEEFHLGYTAGAGVETKFGGRWSARVEYLYVDLGEEDYDLDVGGSSVEADADLDFSLVRGGIAYHF